MSRTLVDGACRPVTLHREIGRGGEGVVFEITGPTAEVAKVYGKPPDAQRTSKLNAMVAGAQERLAKVAAWPSRTLHERPGGPVVGFVMRRLDRHQDIHLLSGPRSRQSHFPTAKYSFLVHVAANVARSFAVVHEMGHVIGDINTRGVCVSERGTVTLVDCDSFQIHCDGQIYACDVATPTHQPPELQAVPSFRGLPRTVNHDLFGLAVLVFEILFFARHPFAGRFLGSGDMPTERAIREYRFAYGRDARRRLMQQPPGSLGLGSVSHEIAELFEGALLEEGVQSGRPTAIQWVHALDKFARTLVPCGKNDGHEYLSSLSQCSLCQLEGLSGVVLFDLTLERSISAPAWNLDALYEEATRIRAQLLGLASMTIQPLPAPPSPSHVVDSINRHRQQRKRFLAFLRRPRLEPLLEERLKLRDQMANYYDRCLEQVRSQQAKIRDFVEHHWQWIERWRRTVKELESESASRLRKFRDQAVDRQLLRYLSSQVVRDCRLKGLGPGLIATLDSYGIQTAADVDATRVLEIPGFGEHRAGQLVAWRTALVARFRFDPADPQIARDSRQEERKYSQAISRAIGSVHREIQELKTGLEQSSPLLVSAARQVSGALGVLLVLEDEAKLIGRSRRGSPVP